MVYARVYGVVYARVVYAGVVYAGRREEAMMRRVLSPSSLP